jgi:hypothetical protein
MKRGTLVRVVHYDPHDPLGPPSDAPVWDATALAFRGAVRHGEIFLMVRAGLLDGGRGFASAGWGHHAEIIHPEWGCVLVEGAFLKAIDELS